jgi:hypothetical protein
MENVAEETNQGNGSKRPTHVAYSVKDRPDGKKATWTPIGVAWTHGDGKGINVSLDCLPLDGRLSLRIIEEKQP